MNPVPVAEVEERLESLEGKLEALSETVRRLERRLSAFETRGTQVETAPAEPLPVEEAVPAASLPQQGDVLNALTQVGRSCLVLGGAFLIRAMTDSGTLPRSAGAALGLSYALLWIVLADRAAGRGRSSSGAFLGVTAVIIAYPLVVETSTRMAIFSPGGAAVILAVLTAACVAVGYRRGLGILAWSSLAAAGASAFVLCVVTRAVEPFAAAFLAIGLGTAWLAYAARPWFGLRWPAAIAADLLVLWAALRLAPSGPPQPGAETTFSFFLLLAFALPFLYLGTFAVSTLVRRQAVTLFDAVQSIAALAVGFGGAALVVRYVEDAQPTLGASALLIAAGCYGVAFVFVERRQGQGRNFLFYATLALLLTAWGSVLVGSIAFRGYAWCALALVSAALASRYARATLAIHSAVYAAGAVWQSGLAAAAVDALAGSATKAWAPFSVAAACALATTAAAYALLVRQSGASGASDVVQSRVPRIILALLFAFGAGGLAVAAFHDHAAGRDPGIVAALRTSVLAAAALLLAGAGRRFTLSELSWLAYAVLILGGIKLLLEDLPSGRPATLFLAFAVYGAALVLAPRLLRRSSPAPGA